jgi:hypothetical protein
VIHIKLRLAWGVQPISLRRLYALNWVIRKSMLGSWTSE